MITLNAGSVESICMKFKRFPTGIIRHCTSNLKMRPSKIFYSALADHFEQGFQVWYGMRSNESTDRKKRYAHIICQDEYEPHEIMPSFYPKYLGKKGVRFRLPILEFTRDEVLSVLNGNENPLYSMGFDRVGCFPCLASGDKYKRYAFNFDETGQHHFAIAHRIADYSGKSIFNKSSTANEQGCMVCAI